MSDFTQQNLSEQQSSGYVSMCDHYKYARARVHTGTHASTRASTRARTHTQTHRLISFTCTTDSMFLLHNSA